MTKSYKKTKKQFPISARERKPNYGSYGLEMLLMRLNYQKLL